MFSTAKSVTQTEFYISVELLVLPSLLLANTNKIWLREYRVFKDVKFLQASSIQQRQAEDQDPSWFLHLELRLRVNSARCHTIHMEERLYEGPTSGKAFLRVCVLLDMGK